MRFAELAGMYYPKDVVRPRDTCVEIGSYDGKNLRESELWSPTVNWHLFEPSPVLFPELNERFSDAPNTLCYPVAVASHTGRTAFYMDTDRGTGNGLYNVVGGNDNDVLCAAMDHVFSQIVKGPARLMLVNCEGAEFDVFRDQSLPAEWLAVSFHRDKHPTDHDGRECVARDLAEQFETIAWFHEETRCQIWIGHNRGIQ